MHGLELCWIMSDVILYLVYIAVDKKKIVRCKGYMVFVFKTCYGGQVLNVHNPVDTFIVQYVALQLRHYNHEMTNGLGNP